MAAAGFKLDTLLKLADVKGTDRKTSLLHFVLDQLLKESSAMHSLPHQLADVKAAANLQASGCCIRSMLRKCAYTYIASVAGSQVQPCFLHSPCFPHASPGWHMLDDCAYQTSHNQKVVVGIPTWFHRSAGPVRVSALQ